MYSYSGTRSTSPSPVSWRRNTATKRKSTEEVMGLEEKLAMLDADSHGVFKLLERRLETATRQLHELQRVEAAGENGDVRRDADMLNELEGLGADLPRIWNTPTTTHRDRKELMRLMVRRVLVEGRDAERIWLRIEWVDGAPPHRCEVWLAAGVRRLIAERVRDGVGTETIVEELKRLGARTTQGNAWTAPRVDHVPNGYRYKSGTGKGIVSTDYRNTIGVAEAVFGHSRVRIPYGITVIGY